MSKGDEPARLHENGELGVLFERAHADTLDDAAVERLAARLDPWLDATPRSGAASPPQANGAGSSSAAGVKWLLVGLGGALVALGLWVTGQPAVPAPAPEVAAPTGPAAPAPETEATATVPSKSTEDPGPSSANEGPEPPLATMERADSNGGRGDRPHVEAIDRKAAQAPKRSHRATAPSGPSPERVTPKGALAEDRLLRRARRALPQNPRGTLELTRRHAREFPRGVLVQEREALAVDALARVGRTSEARKRAERFLRAYPRSAQRARVESVLERLKEDPTR